MKLLWLCNIVPGLVMQKIDGSTGNGLWLDNMLQELRAQGHTIHILCRGTESRGRVDEQCSYTIFEEKYPQVYESGLEELFRQEVAKFQPDVIHIWGTEYGHSLAMVNAAEAVGLLDKTVISIQGLCSVIAEHYADGVPAAAQRFGTLRDFLRRDNILQQQKKYVQRGKLERQTLQKARHVIGRTAWDRGCVHNINPELKYHFCNETLRDEFFSGTWQYAGCTKHSIFASSCTYPVKGFHYLLEAMPQILEQYPDACIFVTGRSYLAAGGWKARMRQMGYQRYLSALTKKYGLENKIHFMGGLNAQKMRQAFLNANVFVLPSTIENSPNSLGEAMLLGVPSVAADVGGVRTLMNHETEGLIYEPGNVTALAESILRIFAMKEAASTLGAAAQSHAQMTHNPEKNFRDLITIYNEIR